MKQEDILIARRYVTKASNATKAGHEFKLTYAQFKKLVKQKHCYYTGVLLNSTDDNSSNYITLDRLDNSIGYTKENTVAAASFVNQFKAILENPTYPVDFHSAKLILEKL